jgi:hypothetical protein
MNDLNSALVSGTCLDAYPFVVVCEGGTQRTLHRHSSLMQLKFVRLNGEGLAFRHVCLRTYKYQRDKHESAGDMFRLSREHSRTLEHWWKE